MGFEFKYTDHPKITKSMQIAIAELGLSKIIVVFPGKSDFLLAQNIRAVGLESLLNAFVSLASNV